jgi:antitoxin (DNA-binding transcriptional repressor) of toxin-antitoxin stability system
MKKTVISVTVAARDFADCISRVPHQNVSYLLLKNGSPVARLVPADEKTCTGRDLAEALRKLDLPTDQAIAWNRDLGKARKALKLPVDRRR